MTDPTDAAWFASRLTERSAKAIARETGAMIRSGALPVGCQLPTVRDLGHVLGVSPATVSEAWKDLRRQKIVDGTGRRGLRVSASHVTARPERMTSVANYGPDILDLSRAVPDPALLPDLGAAMAAGAQARNLNSYHRERILPDLEAILREDWPYEAGELLAVNGGYNGIYTALHAFLRPGALVAIEHPTPMRLLDILEDMAVTILPVERDAEGPCPDRLATTLAQRPAAFLYQPRVNGVTGEVLGPDRLRQLGDVLATSDALIIEDDGVGDLASVPRQSLGARFPDRVVHVLSFSKSLGPDLRLAVLSGSVAMVEEIQSFRLFSSGWTSRILQGAACWLLSSDEARAQVEAARLIYRARRDGLRDGLGTLGIPVSAGEGLCLTAQVEAESYALVTLAAHGIAVQPGSKSSLGRTNYIRIATGMLNQAHLPRVISAVGLARS